jgi:DNA-directed RNA polymerase subunit M/transcription elongation factor TFIIS
MPRLLAADKCPKCRGPMTRQTTMAGTIFVCEKCDADDPIKGADKWVKGELRPPE